MLRSRLQSSPDNSAVPVNLLLIEDNVGDAFYLNEVLDQSNEGRFAIAHVETLGGGLALMRERRFDAVLVDLSLPDSSGLDSFLAVRSQCSDTPVIVLTGLDDQTLALEALHRGAQDYLIKGQIDSRLLIRAILYAMTRNETARLDDQVRRQAAELRKRTRQLKILNSQLTSAEQRERRRLAAVLHDDLQQLLVGMKMMLTQLRNLTDERHLRIVADVQNTIDQSIQCSRTLTLELSPPVLFESGLIPALEWLAQQSERRFGLAVHLDLPPVKTLGVGHIDILLFQMVRELLFRAF